MDANLIYSRYCRMTAVLLAVFCLLVASRSVVRASAPALSITQTPAFGQCGTVMGTTSGITPADYYVALLIYIHLRHGDVFTLRLQGTQSLCERVG